MVLVLRFHPRPASASFRTGLLAQGASKDVGPSEGLAGLNSL